MKGQPEHFRPQIDARLLVRVAGDPLLPATALLACRIPARRATVAGLDRPTTGDIRLAGEWITQMREDELARQRVAIARAFSNALAILLADRVISLSEERIVEDRETGRQSDGETGRWVKKESEAESPCRPVAPSPSLSEVMA